MRLSIMLDYLEKRLFRKKKPSRKLFRIKGTGYKACWDIHIFKKWHISGYATVPYVTHIRIKAYSEFKSKHLPEIYLHKSLEYESKHLCYFVCISNYQIRMYGELLYFLKEQKKGWYWRSTNLSLIYFSNFVTCVK